MNANDHQGIQIIQDAVDGNRSASDAWEEIKRLENDADEAMEQDRQAYRRAIAPPSKIGVTP